MNKEAWLEWRREGIGASDAPVIMEVSPYTTVYQLWEEKVFGATEKSNYAIDRGNRIEPLAMNYFMEQTGITVEQQVLATHSEHTWMRASLDGYNRDLGILVEAKSCMNLPSEVREDHWVQVQHQMAVVDLSKASVVYHNENEGVIFEVERDEKFIAKMIKKEQAFMEKVINLQEPSLSERDFVNQNGSENWKLLSYRYAHAVERIKELEEVKKFLVSQLILEADGKRSEGYGIKLNHITKKGTIDYKNVPSILAMSEEELNKYRKDPIQYWTASVNTKYFDNITFSEDDEVDLKLHAELA